MHAVYKCIIMLQKYSQIRRNTFNKCVIPLKKQKGSIVGDLSIRLKSKVLLVIVQVIDLLAKIFANSEEASRNIFFMLLRIQKNNLDD